MFGHGRYGSHGSGAYGDVLGGGILDIGNVKTNPLMMDEFNFRSIIDQFAIHLIAGTGNEIEIGVLGLFQHFFSLVGRNVIVGDIAGCEHGVKPVQIL
jgi:hypothetical protein